ncbi:unnamed protein product [Eruca vesicaria subsp. sativa]|uniref:Uncharacterized protein n=1 Tax=Eruca vesicaria subsp. sativa TaxID=29727 RepID=A0ABC8ITJ6_ERUVS|nr:unnamed protein product [Eruca vesicaria subsp. sativa]
MGVIAPLSEQLTKPLPNAMVLVNLKELSGGAYINVLGAYASFLWEINDEDDGEVDESFGDRTQQGKEDFQPEGGEKRSSRLSETVDGETLCRYAKAFWSINGDKEKALFYFEKTVEASPNDSIILGEYARFRWEIEE